MNLYIHTQSPPSEEEAGIARDAARGPQRGLSSSEIAPVKVHILSESGEGSGSHHELELPAYAAKTLISILEDVVSGRNNFVIPEDLELSVAQAAKVLDVSESFLINNRLEKDIIPHRKVGKDRLIRMRDVIAYLDDRARRRKILDKIVADSQEMGLYEIAQGPMK